MGKKDKKTKTAEHKARVAVKQNKKAAQKDKKIKSKGTDDSDEEDIDIESVLEEYANKVCYDMLHDYVLHKNTFPPLFPKLFLFPDNWALALELR